MIVCFALLLRVFIILENDIKNEYTDVLLNDENGIYLNRMSVVLGQISSIHRQTYEFYHLLRFFISTKGKLL